MNGLELARPGWAQKDRLLREYYDTEWGVPVTTEQGVFERLCLEILQAGLNWRTILVKREALREIFAGFSPDALCLSPEECVRGALVDERGIRNRRKAEAIVRNARVTVALRGRGVSLERLVWSHMPERTVLPGCDSDVPASTAESEGLAAKLKGEGFFFVGPVVCFSLMCAIGVVDAHPLGCHRRGCSGLWTRQGRRKSFPEGL